MAASRFSQETPMALPVTTLLRLPPDGPLSGVRLVSFRQRWICEAFRPRGLRVLGGERAHIRNPAVILQLLPTILVVGQEFGPVFG
jgi:hypothetical protein